MIRFALAFALASALLAGSTAAQSPAPTTSAARAAGSPTVDPFAGRRKLLIWADVQTGFHGDHLNHALAVIERLGRQSGAYVSIVRTDSQLITKQPIVGKGARYSGRSVNARNLDQFDAIFFLGSGEGTLSPQQKTDLLDFVRKDGKGFVATHTSTVAFFDWPEFGDMLGATMNGEFQVQPLPVVVDDPRFPGAGQFARNFLYSDAFPVMKAPYAKGNFHTIMRLDASRLTPEQRARRPDGDMPIVWAKSYGKGRVYHSGFGHTDESWDDPKVQTMYFEAIRWAMGLTSPDVTPDRP